MLQAWIFKMTFSDSMISMFKLIFKPMDPDLVENLIESGNCCGVDQTTVDFFLFPKQLILHTQMSSMWNMK